MTSSLVACAALLASIAVPALARAGCRPVHGFYTSEQVLPPACAPPAQFCTAGTLIGGIQGEYVFTQDSATFHGTPPPVMMYTGTSVVSPRGGGTVYAEDYGAIDLGSGRQAALLRITGGDGPYEGASGFLTLRGALTDGGAEGEYRGELCTP